MKTVIYVGAERSRLPDIASATGELKTALREADYVLTMNRPCTMAALVKSRNGFTGVVDVVYAPDQP
jgi:hypothetical protein